MSLSGSEFRDLSLFDFNKTGLKALDRFRRTAAENRIVGNEGLVCLPVVVVAAFAKWQWASMERGRARSSAVHLSGNSINLARGGDALGVDSHHPTGTTRSRATQCRQESKGRGEKGAQAP